MENFIHCPICGSGILETLNGGKLICSHCEVILEECAVCEGHGYYTTKWNPKDELDFEDCKTCHGTGFVIVKEEK